MLEGLLALAAVVALGGLLSVLRLAGADRWLPGSGRGGSNGGSFSGDAGGGGCGDGGGGAGGGGAGGGDGGGGGSC